MEAFVFIAHILMANIHIIFECSKKNGEKLFLLACFGKMIRISYDF